MLAISPENLKVLDEYMRDSYQKSPTPEIMILTWGSYFAEVVRDELPEGRWEIEAQG